MFESSMESMVGLVPIAITGGLVLGLTQRAMQIPSQLQTQDETYRPRKKRVRRNGDIWQDLFGIKQ